MEAGEIAHNPNHRFSDDADLSCWFILQHSKSQMIKILLISGAFSQIFCDLPEKSSSPHQTSLPEYSVYIH